MLGYGTTKLLGNRWSIPKILEIQLSIPKILEIQLSIIISVFTY